MCQQRTEQTNRISSFSNFAFCWKSCKSHGGHISDPDKQITQMCEITWTMNTADFRSNWIQLEPTFILGQSSTDGNNGWKWWQAADGFIFESSFQCQLIRFSANDETISSIFVSRALILSGNRCELGPIKCEIKKSILQENTHKRSQSAFASITFHVEQNWFSYLTTKIRHVSPACEQNYCLLALVLFGVHSRWKAKAVRSLLPHAKQSIRIPFN